MHLWISRTYARNISMTKSLSPLRYPGGKSKIFERVKALIVANGYSNRMYVEPFAGGFGLGLALLNADIVPTAILNDYDPHIYCFWHAVLNETDSILRLITDTPVTIEERTRQIQIYNDPDVGTLERGFAMLFLNRVNYSGVIKGGPIGGLNQSGKYKIDCRFNKNDLKKKVELIARLKSRIKLYNKDAGSLIRMNLVRMKAPMFLNIDPPYVIKGSRLYTNFFTKVDHISLYQTVTKYLGSDYPWIITYDDCSLVRELYGDYYMQEYAIAHNAGGTVRGKELVFTNIPIERFLW